MTTADEFTKPAFFHRDKPYKSKVPGGAKQFATSIRADMTDTDNDTRLSIARGPPVAQVSVEQRGRVCDNRVL